MNAPFILYFYITGAVVGWAMNDIVSPLVGEGKALSDEKRKCENVLPRNQKCVFVAIPEDSAARK